MASDASDFDDVSTTLSRSHEAEDAHPAFQLVVADGPDAGQRTVVDDSQPSPVLIGQSPACALRLTDRRVSRRHAAVEV